MLRSTSGGLSSAPSHTTGAALPTGYEEPHGNATVRRDLKKKKTTRVTELLYFLLILKI